MTEGTTERMVGRGSTGQIFTLVDQTDESVDQASSSLVTSSRLFRDLEFIEPGAQIPSLLDR